MTNKKNIKQLRYLIYLGCFLLYTEFKLGGLSVVVRKYSKLPKNEEERA